MLSNIFIMGTLVTENYFSDKRAIALNLDMTKKSH